MRAIAEIRPGATLRDVAPADVADTLSLLEPEQAALAFRLLPRDHAGDAFAELEHDRQEQLIEELGAGAQPIVEAMDPDDRAELIDELRANPLNLPLVRTELLEDPADLKRLIARAGVLEFRIAPFSPNALFARQDPGHELVVTADELGGANVHCRESGVSDYFAEDDAHCIEIIRQIVKNLPPAKKTDIGLREPRPPLYDPREIYGIVLEAQLKAIEGIEAGAACSDVDGLARMRRVCHDRGRVIILVPAHMSIYGELDRSFGHVRRYNRRTLRRAFEAAGLQVSYSFYMNALGYFGWWWQSRWQRREEISVSGARLFNRLVPFLDAAERLPAPAPDDAGG